MWKGALTMAVAVITTLQGIYRHDVDPELYTSLAHDPAFASVGHLRTAAGRTAGSFVLIHPEWVLTAAHVLDDRDVDELVLELAGQRAGIRAVSRHPLYRSDRFAAHEDALFRKGIDAALLRLDRRIESVTPAALHAGTREHGLEATFVGFGTSGDAMSAIANPIAPGTKRAGHNVLDAIGGIVNDRPIPEWYLVSDFDHPDNENLNRTGSADPAALEYLAAGGDSGGGVFVREGSGWVLAGIHSTGRIAINDSIERDGLYGSINLTLHIADIVEWIEFTLRE
jgi:hypothetical protein